MHQLCVLDAWSRFQVTPVVMCLSKRSGDFRSSLVADRVDRNWKPDTGRASNQFD
jgi:hypothetical protein